MAIQLSVTGKAHQVDVDPDTPLLWGLRDDLHLTGTKFGCGRALCAACTVHVHGQAAPLSVTPVEAAAGSEITTSRACPTRWREPCRSPGRSSTSSSVATASQGRS